MSYVTEVDVKYIRARTVKPTDEYRLKGTEDGTILQQRIVTTTEFTHGGYERVDEWVTSPTVDSNASDLIDKVERR